MNIVFLFSDEHASSAMGHSVHPVVRIPHLDRLAAQSYTFQCVLQQLTVHSLTIVDLDGALPTPD